MELIKHYECTISMSYYAVDEREAANKLIENIQANPNWYVKVRDLGTKEEVTVDTETGEIEN